MKCKKCKKEFTPSSIINTTCTVCAFQIDSKMRKIFGNNYGVDPYEEHNRKVRASERIRKTGQNWF
jgi:DNA-directed RNA polymerase subunit RPC12/RpoP